jgi:hypothetical protein
LNSAVQGLGNLHGRRFRQTYARLRSVSAQAERLCLEVEERERFWYNEAEWALNLLGERKPTTWPPEPLAASARLESSPTLRGKV